MQKNLPVHPFCIFLFSTQLFSKVEFYAEIRCSCSNLVSTEEMSKIRPGRNFIQPALIFSYFPTKTTLQMREINTYFSDLKFPEIPNKTFKLPLFWLGFLLARRNLLGVSFGTSLKKFEHIWSIQPLKGGEASSWDWVQKIKNNLNHNFTKFHQLTTYCF